MGEKTLYTKMYCFLNTLTLCSWILILFVENNMGRHCKMYKEIRLRELMLDSFRHRCADERNALAENTQKIRIQWQVLEQLSK